MRLAVLLALAFLGLALAMKGKSGGKGMDGYGKGKGKGKGKGMEPPGPEEDLWMGFDEMPDGCADAMDEAVKCKREQFLASVPLERRVMELRMECYEEHKCRKVEMGEDMMHEKDYNPNPIAAEIGACIQPVAMKLWTKVVGRCLGGPGWEFPLMDDSEMMSEPELAFDVMFPDMNRRKKRSPGMMKKLMAKAGHGNHSEHDMARHGKHNAEYKKMREGMEALEDSWGTMDYLYDCREPGQMGKNYEKRYEVNKCLIRKAMEEGLVENRTELAMKAAKCMFDLPMECARAYRHRSSNWCHCASVFYHHPAVDASVAVCVPSIYHEYSKDEVIGNLVRDFKHSMCKKPKGGKDFDLHDFFHMQEELAEHLMSAVMEGEVDLMEVMEMKMEKAKEMMDGAPMEKMMHKMMEKMMDGDDEDKMMQGYRRMEMMEEMEEQMHQMGKGKGMMNMKKMMMKKMMKKKHMGGGGCQNMRPYPPPPAPMCGDEDGDDYGRGGYGDEGGYGRGGYGKEDGYGMKDGYGDHKGYGKGMKDGYGGKGYGDMGGGYGGPKDKGKCRPKPKRYDSEEMMAT